MWATGQLAYPGFIQTIFHYLLFKVSRSNKCVFVKLCDYHLCQCLWIGVAANALLERFKFQSIIYFYQVYKSPVYK